MSDDDESGGEHAGALARDARVEHAPPTALKPVDDPAWPAVEPDGARSRKRHPRPSLLELPDDLDPKDPRAFSFGNSTLVEQLDRLARESLDEAGGANQRSSEQTAVSWFDAFALETGLHKPWDNRGDSSKAIWFNTTMIMYFIRWIVPRMNKGKGGLPSSAMNYVYLIVGHMAREKGFVFRHSPKRVAAMVKGLGRQLLKLNGPRKVKRKAAVLPSQMALWVLIFRDRVRDASRKQLQRWRVILVMISLAFCGMFRRSEYTHKTGAFNPAIQLTRSDVRWYTERGEAIELNSRTLQSWHRSSPPSGIYCTVAPPPCKNDWDGAKYHHDPLVFEVNIGKGYIGSASLLLAGNYLLGLEMEFPLFDVARDTAPLFVDPTTGGAFRTDPFDKALKGLAADAFARDPTMPDPAEFGLQGLRAGGALALRAAGAPREVIMAMGRWASDTWMIYIRDRRPEALQWGKRMRDVSQLEVARVPIRDRQRPIDCWFDSEPTDTIIQNSLDSQRIGEELMALDARDVQLAESAESDLLEEQEELVAGLDSLLLDKPEGETRFGLEALAELVARDARPSEVTPKRARIFTF